MKISNHKKVKGLVILSLFIMISLTSSIMSNISNINTITKIENYVVENEKNPLMNLPSSDYEWWNNSWTLRIPVGITAIGQQQDAPVELYINFTKNFKDLDIQNPILNTSSIRVIEYTSSSNYYEVESQFDPYIRSYNNETNAIGDLIWILNGTTINGQTRDFFIYFINGTSPDVPKPNYDILRLWHEGFEEYQVGDILRPTDGQDNSHPNYWEISNTTSARGTSSLRIWGNCWKASYTGSITVNSDTRVTAKMRFDDPSIQREISGLGFHTIYNNIPAAQNSYEIRGNQNWGTAGSGKFRNLYYAASTFFWYTFIPSTEFSLNPFSYIFYIADDDAWTNLNLYWDDISIWAKPVQTTPNNSLQTNIGNIQPISFTLKVTCKDEDGFGVPQAHIYITNDDNPLLNQDHITDTNGEWLFTSIVKDGLYNITINYTQNGVSSPETQMFFYRENYPIVNLNNALLAFLTLTTINFNITDKDNDPIDYGYVLLKEGSNTVGKTILSTLGVGTIRWKNNTAYNYEAYYDYDSLPDNSKYRYSSLLIYNDTVGTNNIEVSTEISKIIFNVTDNTAEKVPFTNAKLRFYNQSDYDNENQIIANVSVDINGIARFVSFSNSYGTWGDYSLDIYFGGQEVDFIADGGPLDHEYNFTLITETQVSIEIPLNKNLYNSTINLIQYNPNVMWGENLIVYFNFTKQDPDFPLPTKVTPNEIKLQILDQELSEYSAKIDILSSEIAEGEFNYSLNTATFNLIGGNTYYFKILGNYKSYIFNEKTPRQIIVQSIPTNIRYYDYDLNQLSNKTISAIFLESVNITVDYYNSITGSPLASAQISYSWDYGSGTLESDPMHTGLYYFEFDTSAAPSTAQYIIDISSYLQNYSTIEDSIIMDISDRPTSLNGSTTLFQISPNIFVFESKNFIFEYEDILSSIIIGDLDLATYNWYKLDENGNPLGGVGNEGSDNLIKGENNQYILDFGTETRSIGEYTLFITLQKKNYEVRNAFISLSIKRRPINPVLSATGLSGEKVKVVQGTSIHFRVTLYDPLNGSQFLIGANVTLNIVDSHKNYNLDETSNGVYEFTFPTDNIDAFFMPQTLTAYIIVEKENYETKTIRITIVVEMVEIFPGMPLFYFLMIVIAVGAVVGSLVTYRYVQQKRIPTFVKKARAMKGDIKGRKTISESLLYPSKEEYIIEKFGDKWEMLGLSLEDILGIEAKKRKKMSEIKEEYEEFEGGGI